MRYNTLKLMPILGILFIMLGCNHLFYQPDQIIRPTWQQIYPEAKQEYILNSANKNKIALIRFPTSKPEPQGVILHFHGNAENMTTHFAYVAWLVDYGFDVITFDYRGYGESEGTPERQGLIEDGKQVLTLAAKYAMEKGHLPLVIIGQSLGGAVAIPVIAQSPEVSVKAVVLDSSFSSYRMLAREKLGSFFLTWPLQWPLSFLVTDEESPDQYLSLLSIPMLIIHSRFDPVVPYSQSKAIERATQHLPSEFWTIEDNYQHTAAFLNESPYRQKLVTWLEKHLP